MGLFQTARELLGGLRYERMERSKTKQTNNNKNKGFPYSLLSLEVTFPATGARARGPSLELCLPMGCRLPVFRLENMRGGE